jgi:hypothetical protein
MWKYFPIVLLVFVTACATPTTGEVLATSTPVATATATITASPTPEPTPIAGGGQIILTAPFEMYKETNPELGEGRHLFLFDLSDHSLTPLTSAAGSYNAFSSLSPNGDFLIFGSSADPLYMGNCSFYLLDMASGESSLIAGAINSYSCQNSSGHPTWLSENTLAYVAADTNGLKRIYIFDPYSKELRTITPDDKSVDTFTVVTPNGPFFWYTCRSSGSGCTITGNYQTSVSGETIELDIHITEEDPPRGEGRWIYQAYGSAGASAGAADYFRLTDPEKNAVFLVQDFFYAEYVRDFGVNLWSWSPNQTKAIISASVTGQPDSPLNGLYLWDIEAKSLHSVPTYLNRPVSWSPDGETLLLLSYDDATNETRLQKYSIEDDSISGEVVAPWANVPGLSTGEVGTGLNYSPDGRWVLMINWEHEPVMVDVASLASTALQLPESWIAGYRENSEPNCVITNGGSSVECVGSGSWYALNGYWIGD